MRNEEKDNLWKLSALNTHESSPCRHDKTTCNCVYNGKCIRKDNNSNIVGVCWMEIGQGEY